MTFREVFTIHIFNNCIGASFHVLNVRFHGKLWLSFSVDRTFRFWKMPIKQKWPPSIPWNLISDSWLHMTHTLREINIYADSLLKLTRSYSHFNFRPVIFGSVLLFDLHTIYRPIKFKFVPGAMLVFRKNIMLASYLKSRHGTPFRKNFSELSHNVCTPE